MPSLLAKIVNLEKLRLDYAPRELYGVYGQRTLVFLGIIGANLVLFLLCIGFSWSPMVLAIFMISIIVVWKQVRLQSLLKNQESKQLLLYMLWSAQRKELGRATDKRVEELAGLGDRLHYLTECYLAGDFIRDFKAEHAFHDELRRLLEDLRKLEERGKKSAGARNREATEELNAIVEVWSGTEEEKIRAIAALAAGLDAEDRMGPLRVGLLGLFAGRWERSKIRVIMERSKRKRE